MSKARPMQLAECCRSLFRQRGPVQHADMPALVDDMSRLTGASVVACVQVVNDLLARHELIPT